MCVSVYVIKFNKSIRAYLKYFLNLLLTRYSYIKSLKESTPSLVNLLHKLYAHLELRKPQKQKSGQKVPKQANASRSNPPRKSGYAPHWHQPAKTGGKWHKKRTKKVVAHLHLRENKGKHHCCPRTCFDGCCDVQWKLLYLNCLTKKKKTRLDFSQLRLQVGVLGVADSNSYSLIRVTF